MNYRELTAPCGLDCFNCPMYRAARDDEYREKLAVRMGLPPDKAKCEGCRAEDGAPDFLGWSEPCGVYQCITKKGLELCCDCDEFPCDYLHPYADRAAEVPHNTKVFNLCLIKKLGFDKWAEEKASEVKQKYFKAKFTLS